MGATEFAPEIRKRHQTNELVIDSIEFGTSSVFATDIPSVDREREAASIGLTNEVGPQVRQN
jgi:hypothetical protein